MRVCLWLLMGACAASSSEVDPAMTDPAAQALPGEEAPESQAAWMAECLGEASSPGEFVVHVVVEAGRVTTAEVRSPGASPAFEACLSRRAPGLPLGGTDGPRDLNLTVY